MSKRLGVIGLLLLFNLWPLCSLSQASTTVLAEVTVRSLKVRDLPRSEGKLIGGLRQGDRITATLLDSGWAKFLLNGKTTAYVSTSCIRTIAVLSREEPASPPPAQPAAPEPGVAEAEKTCRAATANLNVKIDTVDLKCNEALLGAGYDACRALFDLTLISDCTEKLRAFITCEAEFLYQKTDDFLPLRATELTSEIVPISYGHANHQTQVLWRPNLRQGNVAGVQLNTASCAVYSVYDD